MMKNYHVVINKNKRQIMSHSVTKRVTRSVTKNKDALVNSLEQELYATLLQGNSVVAGPPVTNDPANVPMRQAEPVTQEFDGKIYYPNGVVEEKDSNPTVAEYDFALELQLTFSRLRIFCKHATLARSAPQRRTSS